VSTITVEVAPGLSRGAHGDTDTALEAGAQHELDLGDDVLGAAVAAAVDAGSLLVVAGRAPAGEVEPQKQSLAKLREADKARAPLYEQRDAEYAQAASDEDRQAVLELYEASMAEVAQIAVEGMT